MQDGSGVQSTATVTVAVSAVNDPPVGVDDTEVTDVDSAIPIDVLLNDTDPDSVDVPPTTNADLSVVDPNGVETQGVLLKTIENPNPLFRDLFGRGLVFDGDRFVVGAPMDDAAPTNPNDFGVAYVYDSEGKLLHTLQKDVPSSGDNFGWSVDMSGDFVVVGRDGRYGYGLTANGFGMDTTAQYSFTFIDGALSGTPSIQVDVLENAVSQEFFTSGPQEFVANTPPVPNPQTWIYSGCMTLRSMLEELQQDIPRKDEARAASPVRKLLFLVFARRFARSR